MGWCSGMHSWDVLVTGKDREGTRESFWWSPFCCFRQCGGKQWKMSPTGAQPAAPIVRIWQPIGVLCLTKITALWGPSSHINSFTGSCLWEQRPGPSSCSFGRVSPCLWHPGPWGQYWLLACSYLQESAPGVLAQLGHWVETWWTSAVPELHGVWDSE